MDAKQNQQHGNHVMAHNLHEYGHEFSHLLHEKRFWELAGVSLLVASAITVISALADPYSLQMMFQAYAF